MTRTALMARLLDHVAAEPEKEAAHRWEQIQRAACDFRRAYMFSPDLARVSFPPMTAAEAERARDTSTGRLHHHRSRRERRPVDGHRVRRAMCPALGRPFQMRCGSGRRSRLR